MAAAIFFLFIQLAISLTYALYESDFTYRFGEWANADNCNDYYCMCANQLRGNLCECVDASEEVNVQFTLEAPLAALYIQLGCYPKERNPIWPPVKAGEVKFFTPPGSPLPSILISGNEGVLADLTTMPDEDLQIRYDMVFESADNPKSEIELNLFNIINGKLVEGDYTFDYIVILIPGWQSDFGKMFTFFEDAILEHSNYGNNVAIIRVDWLFGNQFYLGDNERIYEPAAANTVYVGYHLAYYIFRAMTAKDSVMESAEVHLIGFDLGSHVAHYAGQMYQELVRKSKKKDIPKQFHRISCLDPPFYLFENDGPSKKDAEYVDIYHSSSVKGSDYGKGNLGSFSGIENTENEQTRKKEIMENLKYQRFGYFKNAGSADFFIIRDVDQDHAHPQCDISHLETKERFGCRQMMAARVFLDSLLRSDESSEFKIGIFSMGINAYGPPRAKGQFNFPYITTLCSVRGKHRRPFSPFISSDDEDAIHGHAHPLPEIRTFDKFPLDTPGPKIRVKGEFPSCGKFKPKEPTGRIWQGHDVYADMFPWIACIKQRKITIHKYIYMLKEGELYEREKTSKFGDVSISERMSVLNSEGARYDIADKTEQLCTGSVIGSNWILTAAHCFTDEINEHDIPITIGAIDCLKDIGTSDHTVNVEMELKDSMTIFIPKLYKDAWKDRFDTWAASYGGLLSAIELNFPKAIDFKMYENDSSIDDEANQFQYGFTWCEKVTTFEREIKLDFDDKGKGSDIALVRLTNAVPYTSGFAPICFKSSADFDPKTFNQHVYLAGYGLKGYTIYGGPDAESLKWLSFLTEFGLQDTKSRLSFAPPDRNNWGSLDKYYIHLGHEGIDPISGLFFTSAACGGDSGGPLFYFATNAIETFAIQIGVISHINTNDLTGNVLIERSPNKTDGCAGQFIYNIYAKKYFVTSEKVTPLSRHLDWIVGAMKEWE